VQPASLGGWCGFVPGRACRTGDEGGAADSRLQLELAAGSSVQARPLGGCCSRPGPSRGQRLAPTIAAPSSEGGPKGGGRGCACVGSVRGANAPASNLAVSPPPSLPVRWARTKATPGLAESQQRESLSLPILPPTRLFDIRRWSPSTCRDRPSFNHSICRRRTQSPPPSPTRSQPICPPRASKLLSARHLVVQCSSRWLASLMHPRHTPL